MTTKLIVMVGFVVAFFAGVMTGLRSQPVAPTSSPGINPPPTTHPSGRRERGVLMRELNLTPEQQQQMDQIWSSVASRGSRDQDDRRRQLRQERDEAILALIRPEDRPAYEQVLKTHGERTNAMDQEMRKAFEDAIKRTNEILTPEQRVKYEEIRRRFQPGDRDRDRGQRGSGRSERSDRSSDDERDRRAGHDRATTRPAENNPRRA